MKRLKLIKEKEVKKNSADFNFSGTAATVSATVSHENSGSDWWLINWMVQNDISMLLIRKGFMSTVQE